MSALDELAVDLILSTELTLVNQGTDFIEFNEDGSSLLWRVYSDFMVTVSNVLSRTYQEYEMKSREEVLDYFSHFN